MRFSENRVIAWCVFAACVLFSLSFSGGGALKNLRMDTEQIFYQGVHADGLSIGNDLSVRAEAAYNLASTAGNYPDIGKSLTEAAREASGALSAAATISEKQAADAQVQRAVEDLYTAIENTAMSQGDQSFCYKQYKEFQSRADTISRDPYNQKAAQFNQTLRGFPASLVGSLTGVKPLELFGQ